MLLRKSQEKISTFIVLYSIEKNPLVSGPVYFKPMLFKGRLYFEYFNAKIQGKQFKLT